MTASSLSFDELAAINDELAALVRAGVPLETTLGKLGCDVPGRLGQTMTDLAARVERGENLPQALAAMPGAFPPLYVAAVEAGIRAGRLPAVLEDLTTAARQQSELRRSVALAMVYPFLVVLVAWQLFWFFADRLAGPLSAVYEGREPALLTSFRTIGAKLETWGLVAGLILILLFAIWQYRMLRGRATLSWVPVAGQMIRNARLASLSGILAVLIDHDVPLGEALALAGNASGDRRLAESARRLAGQIEQGCQAGLPSGEPSEGKALPSLFRWLAQTGHRKELLVPLLKQSAENHRRRALRDADWIRFYLPLLLTAAIGGVVVLCYGLALFVPVTQLLRDAASVHFMSR